MKNHRIIFALLFLVCSGIVVAEEAAQKAVLVTGASSGSGRIIAETLAARGYYVYAGARKQADLDALNEIENIHAIRLDVTIQSEIDAAVATVRNKGKGLYGLVNNAGVAVLGPLVEIPESDVEFVFDVNVYGPYRVTKAFAPLIIESKGRITTTGSISGILSRQFYGPYSMSKHAMEAFTDSLAAEMNKFDVKVSIIEPGGFNSKIGTTTFDRMKANGFNFDDSLYKEEWEQSWILQDGGNYDLKNNVPEEIAYAVIDTLESDNPKVRYMIVGTRESATATVQKALQEAVQINENHEHSLSRDELISMLDELMNP
jgi:NAD(P)-dependent dehydrogenase (short-subunit alcohol dehydrogenase family)